MRSFLINKNICKLSRFYNIAFNGLFWKKAWNSNLFKQKKAFIGSRFNKNIEAA